jgi:hypothetical protein
MSTASDPAQLCRGLKYVEVERTDRSSWTVRTGFKTTSVPDRQELLVLRRGVYKTGGERLRVFAVENFYPQQDSFRVFMEPEELRDMLEYIDGLMEKYVVFTDEVRGIVLRYSRDIHEEFFVFYQFGGTYDYMTDFYYFHEKGSNFWRISSLLTLGIAAKKYLKISAEYGMTSYYGIIEPESEEHIRIFDNLMGALIDVFDAKSVDEEDPNNFWLVHREEEEFGTVR